MAVLLGATIPAGSALAQRATPMTQQKYHTHVLAAPPTPLAAKAPSPARNPS